MTTNVHLSRLAEVIRDSSLLRDQRRAKSLGQHFLTDPSILSRIVDLAGPLKDQTVLEIGPGPGGLTREILKRSPFHLIAVEKDPNCWTALKPLLDAYSSIPCSIINGDFLQLNISSLLLSPDRPLHVIANLPYNVGTEILIRLLRKIKHFAAFTLMFQKEVAERIFAPCGTKDYGRLSVLVQYLTTGRRVMTLPPGAFTPPPKVFSSVIHLVPKSDVDRSLTPYLEKVTEAVFQVRRKMLRQSLLSLWPKDELGKVLNRCKIEAERRPETLSVAEFEALATQLRAPAHDFS